MTHKEGLCRGGTSIPPPRSPLCFRSPRDLEVSNVDGESDPRDTRAVIFEMSPGGSFGLADAHTPPARCPRGSHENAFAASTPGPALGRHPWMPGPRTFTLGGWGRGAACPIGAAREFRKTECNYLNWSPAKALELLKKKKSPGKTLILAADGNRTPAFLPMSWQRGA